MPVIANLRPLSRGDHFRAHGLRDAAGRLDPFIGVDHAWMSAPTFPAHPHAGFSAVSYVFADSETGIDNRDSLGTRNRIRPGGLHWTAAGSGIVHQEDPAEAGKTVHSLQIFVQLPPAAQNGPPSAHSLAPEDIPQVRLPGARIRVALGTFDGRTSPLTPPTPVTLLDIELEDGASVTLTVPAGDGAFLLPIAGEAAIDGTPFTPDGLSLPVYPADGRSRAVVVQARNGPAHIVFFQGQPLTSSLNRHQEHQA
ncbi:pirin family protein [Chromobacterium vaccinii]|uniref:pirin family protein n=1 Tax=Chromobacterium vaccinii TaxID=1108595 RepID=UPI003C785F93